MLVLNALRDTLLGASLVAFGLAVGTILLGAAIGLAIGGFALLVADALGLAL